MYRQYCQDFNSYIQYIYICTSNILVIVWVALGTFYKAAISHVTLKVVSYIFASSVYVNESENEAGPTAGRRGQIKRLSVAIWASLCGRDGYFYLDFILGTGICRRR